MKIKELSISDLKASYDFVLLDLSELEQSAKDKGISTSEIPAYSEVKKIENDLFTELLNRTRMLEL